MMMRLALFSILFLIAPFVSRSQARNEEKPDPQDHWAVTSENEPEVRAAMSQALSVLRSARAEFKALVVGIVHIKFTRLPKDHFAAIDPYYPNEVQVNRENFEQTVRELGDIGYFADEALRFAAFLWAPSLAHEISHSLNFGELIKLTGLEPPPYVLEEEIHGHVSRARAVADVLKGHVSEDIMWQTSIGQFNVYRLRDFSKGPAYLRESVVTLYADLPSIFESNPDSTRVEMQHKLLFAAGKAEARGTRVAEEDRKAWENQYKFWSDPELIEKVRDFYAAQTEREKKFFKTGK